MTMNHIKLNELAKRIRESDVPTHFKPIHSRLLIEIWRLVAKGKPVSANQIEQTALHLNMPFEAAQSFIDEVSERDESGNVVGIFGLSQKEHPHKFQVNGRTFSTWCAWDALFLPGMLKQTAHVESSCPATKEKIKLTLTPEGVQNSEPTDAVLSIITPQATESGFDKVEEVWMAFCCHVHFFNSLDAASEWFADKSGEVTFLSIEEGYRLGQLAFMELLEFV